MTIETEKQFAGNYVRLVNQVRSLQGDIAVKEQMLDYLITANLLNLNNYSHECEFNSAFTKEYERIELIAVEELVAEQNKKAAGGSNNEI